MNCGSAFELGASGLPYYFTLPRHTTCVRSCCTWRASCVAAKHTKNQKYIAEYLRAGTAGLPYYCTPPVCVPDVIDALVCGDKTTTTTNTWGWAVWRHNNQKKKLCSRASGLPFHCIPPVNAPDVISARAVWRQNKNSAGENWSLGIEKTRDSLTAPSCCRHSFPCSSAVPCKNYRHFSQFWDQLYSPFRLGLGTKVRLWSQFQAYLKNSPVFFGH